MNQLSKIDIITSSITFLAVGSINISMAQAPEQLYEKCVVKEEREAILRHDLLNEV